MEPIKVGFEVPDASVLTQQSGRARKPCPANPLDDPSRGGHLLILGGNKLGDNLQSWVNLPRGKSTSLLAHVSHP